MYHSGAGCPNVGACRVPKKKMEIMSLKFRYLVTSLAYTNNF